MVEANEGQLQGEPFGQAEQCLICSLLRTFHFIASVSFYFLSIGVIKSAEVCSEYSRHSLNHPQGAAEMAHRTTKPQQPQFGLPEPIWWKERTNSTDVL